MEKEEAKMAGVEVQENKNEIGKIGTKLMNDASRLLMLTCFTCYLSNIRQKRLKILIEAKKLCLFTDFFENFTEHANLQHQMQKTRKCKIKYPYIKSFRH